MGNVKLDDFNVKRAGERAVLVSEQARAMCHSKAEQMAGRANGMYAANGYIVKDGGRKRARSYVVTGDRHTVNSNRLHQTLQKVLHS